MPKYKDPQEEMRNKLTDICQSGRSQLWDLGTPVNHAVSQYPQMEKTYNSGELSQSWPAYQNHSRRSQKNPEQRIADS